MKDDPSPDPDDAQQGTDLVVRLSNLATVRIGLVLIAAVWLGYEFVRLVSGFSDGGIDLEQRRGEVQLWFEGAAVYREVGTAVYPPASYVILWPLLGWIEEASHARWMWALTSMPLLVILVRQVLAASGAQGLRERQFVALMPLTLYATGATIGNGQLTLLVMVTLFASLNTLGLADRQSRVAGACWFLLALVKPTVAAPFFWLLVFRPRAAAMAVGVVLGYAVVTLIAVTFQEASVLVLLDQFFNQAQEGVNWGSVHDSYVNQSSWLSGLGVPELSTLSSLVTLGLLGLWVFCQRHKDPWLLIGVCALVSRFWVYHLWYDDLVLLMVLVGLLRISRKEGGSRQGRIAVSLMLALWLSLLAPGGLYLLPDPWKGLYVFFQLCVWLSALIFLMVRTLGDRTNAGSGRIA